MKLKQSMTETECEQLAQANWEVWEIDQQFDRQSFLTPYNVRLNATAAGIFGMSEFGEPVIITSRHSSGFFIQAVWTYSIWLDGPILLMCRKGYND